MKTFVIIRETHTSNYMVRGCNGATSREGAMSDARQASTREIVLVEEIEVKGINKLDNAITKEFRTIGNNIQNRSLEWYALNDRDLMDLTAFIYQNASLK